MYTTCLWCFLILRILILLVYTFFFFKKEKKRKVNNVSHYTLMPDIEKMKTTRYNCGAHTYYALRGDRRVLRTEGWIPHFWFCWPSRGHRGEKIDWFLTFSIPMMRLSPWLNQKIGDWGQILTAGEVFLNLLKSIHIGRNGCIVESGPLLYIFKKCALKSFKSSTWVFIW